MTHMHRFPPSGCPTYAAANTSTTAGYMKACTRLTQTHVIDICHTQISAYTRIINKCTIRICCTGVDQIASPARQTSGAYWQIIHIDLLEPINGTNETHPNRSSKAGTRRRQRQPPMEENNATQHHKVGILLFNAWSGDATMALAKS